MNRESKHGLSQALSQIVAGAFLLTLKDGQSELRGIVLSFVQQVGLEPPRIVASVHKERPIVSAIERVRTFVLNVCAAGEQEAVRRLAEAAEDMPHLLRDLTAQDLDAGVVVQPAAAYLVCQVVERVDIGDHWLYIADVVDGATVTGRGPLVHVRRSGLRY